MNSRRTNTARLSLLALTLAGAITAAPAAVASAADGVRVEAVDAALSPNGDGRGDALDLTIKLASPRSVTLTVLDSSGTATRLLWSGPLGAGQTAFSWDGTNDAGAVQADGTYRLVATDPATGTQLATAVTHIDTAPPSSRPVRVRLRANQPIVSLPVRISEQSLIAAQVRDGRRARSLTFLGAGTTTVQVRAPRAWLGRKRRMKKTVRLTLTDSAWNTSTVTAQVQIVPVPHFSTASVGDALSAGGSVAWPLRGPISSPFGPRWGRMHEGLDIAVPTGTPIHAAAAGTVTYAGVMSGYGNVVFIDHGNGMITRYGHQSRIASHVGQHVGTGDVIGYVGATGDATGPHLHFEVRINGVARNPLLYL